MTRYIGLDWDQNQLQVVSAEIRGGKVQILKAASWQETQSPNPGEADSQGKLLRERLQSAGIAPAPVLACLARDRVIMKDLRIPPVAAGDEPDVVRFQAIKELTYPPEEAILDYTVVPDERNAEQRRALVVIARQELVQTYQVLCQNAGLKLAGLIPRPYGLAAALRKVMGASVLVPRPEPPDGAVAVVAVGERWAEFVVLRGDHLLLARALTPGDGLAGEIRRNLAVYAGQAGQQPIRAIYLTGLPSSELRQRLADMVDLPLHTFEPFAGSDSVNLPASNRGAFTAAAGVLFARAEPRGLPINFTQPRKAQARQDPNRFRILAAAGLLLALLVGIGAYARSSYVDMENDLAQLEKERASLESQLVVVRENSKRLKALDDWDNLVWLDELYDLTARIPSVNNLRVTQLTAEPLPRNTKSRYAARMTIKGTLNDSRDIRGPLDELIRQFTKDGYYSPEAPKVVGNVFTLSVNIERRAPTDYKRQLEVNP